MCSGPHSQAFLLVHLPLFPRRRSRKRQRTHPHVKSHIYVPTCSQATRRLPSIHGRRLKKVSAPLIQERRLIKCYRGVASRRIPWSKGLQPVRRFRETTYCLAPIYLSTSLSTRWAAVCLASGTAARRHRKMGRLPRRVVKAMTTTTITTTTIAPAPSVLFSLLLALLLGTGSARESSSNRNITNNINAKSPSSSPSASACVAADGSLILTTAVIVSTRNEATQLADNLLRCPGATFEVEWRGSVQISAPLALSDGTLLEIAGSQGGESTAVAAAVRGGGSTALFELNGASLRLEGLELTGGNAAEGGAIAARGNALVTFVECKVYENAATSMGGEIERESIEKQCLIGGGGCLIL